MTITQVYPIVNAATKAVLGESAVVNEDLSNVVDIGTDVLSTRETTVAWLGNVHDQVGKMIFVDRLYKGRAPSLLMDAWEYGSIVEKVRMDLPEASENEAWELKNGASYDPNIYHGGTYHAKFFNKRVTFEVDISIPEYQIEQAFQNATQMVAFISMIRTTVENSFTVKMDALAMRTLNNMSAEVLHANIPDGDYANNSTAQAVNLLYLYKQENPNSTLTPETCIKDPDFIRFAVYTMDVTRSRLAGMSKIFNVGKTDKFTPDDRLHFVLLSDFSKAANVFLQSNTYHDNLTKLSNFDEVSFWQGSGTNYAFNEITKIDVKTTSNDIVTATGILGVMHDRDAAGISNLGRRTDTEYNKKANFFTDFNKMFAGYFNDLDENYVVFFVA